MLKRSAATLAVSPTLAVSQRSVATLDEDGDISVGATVEDVRDGSVGESVLRQIRVWGLYLRRTHTSGG